MIRRISHNFIASVSIATAFILAVVGIVLAVVLPKKNEPVLVDIEIATQPNKVTYFENETFNTAGLTVRAHYNNKTSKIVTDWMVDKIDPLLVTDTAVTVSYTEKGITKTTTVAITANPILLQSIEKVSNPIKTQYTEGEYFDFLGLQIRAYYNNGTDAIVYDWDWDIKIPLVTGNNNVVISFGGQTVNIAITVIETTIQDEEISQVETMQNLLLPVDDLEIENLEMVQYILDRYNNLAPEQKEQLGNNEVYELLTEKVAELEQEQAALPPPPEPTYNITYALFNGLNFADIDYGDNITTYKNSDGTVSLDNPISITAAKQGYEFSHWTDGFGNTITIIQNIASDMAYYAVLELTETMQVIYKDYNDKETELYSEIITRENNGGYVYNLNATVSGKMVIAYYYNNVKTTAISTQSGNAVTIYVVAAACRNIMVETAADLILSWQYTYTDDNEETVAVSSGALATQDLLVPVGANLTVTATGLQVNQILIDSEVAAARSGSVPANATAMIIVGEDVIAITVTRTLAATTTISFNGLNTKSYIYQSGWNGKLPDYDLYDISVVFAEDDNNYLNTYVINGTEYLFEQIGNYTFTADTAVIVNRKPNKFSITVNYGGVSIAIGSLIGKQTLQNALIGKSGENINTFSYILANENLFTDSELQNEITANDLLNIFLIENIVLYSNFEGFPPPTVDDLYGTVNYTNENIIGEWTALFNGANNMYEITIRFTIGGNYNYMSKINGNITAEFSGVYRL
jgi:hypothetical protein